MSRSLALDHAHVARTHAEQLLLRGHERFEPLVGVAIADPFRLEPLRSIDSRCAQQRHNRALERQVELVGGSEIAMCVFDPRLQRRIQSRGAGRIDRRDRIGDRRIAIVAAGIGGDAAVTRRDAVRRRWPQHFEMLGGCHAFGDIGDDDREVADQAGCREPRHHRGALRQPLHQRPHQRVARVQRRQRDRIAGAAERRRCGRGCRS